MSRFYVGAEFINNQGCKFKLIKRAQEARYWVVQFESGYVTTAKDSNIPYGKVKDYFTPTVYGVGYLGSSRRIPARKYGTTIRKKYDLWANMLKRVYGGYREAWNADYTDVEVCPTWHNFTTFANEIEEVPGYEAWLEDTTMCLDKDLAGRRLYSKNTCKFISNAENLSEASTRRWRTLA